jgi:hypothetical protein
MTIDDLKIPPFECNVEHHGRQFNLLITQVSIDQTHEVFEVCAGKTVKRLFSLRPHYRLAIKSACKVDVRPVIGTPVHDKEGLKKVAEIIESTINFFESRLVFDPRMYHPT